MTKLAETGRARPGDDTPPELTRLFPAHDVPRTVNGTGHTGPSEFCATSI